MNIYRDYAEELIEAGYSVTPTKQNKAPVLARDWQKTTGETILLPKYNADWAQAKGLGLLCGRPSGIFCLDVDIRSDTDDTELLAIREKIQEMLPPIYSGRSGSKFKPPARLFRWNGEENEKFKAIDVEILSTGNQCVIPPSLHPEGHEYAWAGRAIHDCEPDDFPDLPDEVVAYLRETNLRRKGEYTPDKLLKSTPGRCKSGSHNYLSGIGVALRFANEKPRDIVNRLIFEDQKINAGEPSLYFECKSRRWRSSEVIENAQSFVEEICKRNKPDPINEKYPTMKTGFHFKIEPPEGSKAKVKWVPDIEGLAQYFLKEKHLVSTDGLNYVWEKKSYYQSITKRELAARVNKIVKPQTKLSAVREFITKTQNVSYKSQREMPQTPDGFLNCVNGVLDLSAQKLKPHSTDMFFKYVLDHKFDPDAQCPTFDAALTTVTGGDTELVRLIAQVFGYCIEGGYPRAHKAFMFTGDGGNGKSTIIKALEDLVGEANRSSVGLALFDKPFSTISMDGKLVNLVDETPRSNINPEAFKNIVSGGNVRAAFKGQDEVDLKINARIVFACNKMPNFRDNSDGMTRRLVAIPFNNKIGNVEKDVNISEKIKAEMSGVLNFAVGGLADLRENGYQFYEPKAVQESMKEYVTETNSALAFIHEYVEFDPDPAVAEWFEPIATTYNNYKLTCDFERQPPMAMKTFSEILKKYLAVKYDEAGFFHAGMKSTGSLLKSIDGKDTRGFYRITSRHAVPDNVLKIDRRPSVH